MENANKTVNNENQQAGCPNTGKACPGVCTHEEISQSEALLDAKNSLIDNMIYHIRTLSNAVIGFSDLLSDEPLEEDAHSYVREIHNAGLGLSVLVNEMLDWTQLLTGRLKINKTKFPVSDILNEIQKLLSWALNTKGLNYEIVTDPDMPAYLNTDQDRLLKCLVNLTASAIKHTPEGTVRIHVKAEDLNGELFARFDIIDTGKGIAPEKLESIFESTVFRIEMDEEILSQLQEGLTVTTGLPLTKQLCQLLGGSLEVQSQLNEGSTFSLRIPVGVVPGCEPKLGSLAWQEESPQQDETDPEPSDPEPSNTGPKNILLVEDQQSNRTVITLMLQSLGVQVDAAENGSKALDCCEDNVYDLILMDLKMPNMDGFETTRQLRHKGVTTPIVALSATVMNEQDHYHISKMFDSFLTKPVSSEKLAMTLKQFSAHIPAGPETNTCEMIQCNQDQSE